MSCAFDLAHDGELLEAAKEGGYRFATFDRSPLPAQLGCERTADSPDTQRVQMSLTHSLPGPQNGGIRVEL